MFVKAICNHEKILSNTNSILYIEHVPSKYPYAPSTVYAIFQCGDTTKRALVKKQELRDGIDTSHSNDLALNWVSIPLPNDIVKIEEQLLYL